MRRSGVAGGDDQVLPIRWSDNDVTLWPGEEQTITARYRAGARPVVRLSGYNLKTQEIKRGLNRDTKSPGWRRPG